MECGSFSSARRACNAPVVHSRMSLMRLRALSEELSVGMGSSG
jgi:hypothetical protein